MNANENIANATAEPIAMSGWFIITIQTVLAIDRTHSNANITNETTSLFISTQFL